MITVLTSPVMPNISIAPTAMMPSITAAAPTAWPSVENWVTAVAHPIAPPACAGAAVQRRGDTRRERQRDYARLPQSSVDLRASAAGAIIAAGRESPSAAGSIRGQ